MAFIAPLQGGKATLRYATPIGWHLLSVLEAGLWLAAARILMVDRRRRRRSGTSDGDWTAPAVPAPADKLVVGDAGGSWRPRRAPEPVAVPDGDELWS